MQSPTAAKLCLIALSLTFIACAGFEPVLTSANLHQSRMPTARSSHRGLEISVEEFASKRKSQQAFDSEIAAQGVFAALVRVENNSAVTYRLPKHQIKAFLGGEPLPALEARAAATHGAARDPSGRALAWTAATGPFALLIAPLTLVGSSAHTRAVNKNIEEHFGSLEFPNALVRQQQSVAGFVYFKLPGGISRLEDIVITIEPTDDSTEETSLHKFHLPPVDVELPISPRDRQRIEE